MVHPTGPGGALTLWDQLRETLAFEIVNGGQISLINRLDRETSGVVLVAKNRPAAQELHAAMQRGEIEKTYQAIVFGSPVSEAFCVAEPVVRQGSIQPTRIYLKRMVHPNGAPALTRFRVLRRLDHPMGKFALLEAVPQTGRTHQIRVHLQFAGWPIVGDKIYGPDETCYLRFIQTGWTAELERKLLLPRQALHATRLRLVFRNTQYDFEAPFPRDLADFLR